VDRVLGTVNQRRSWVHGGPAGGADRRVPRYGGTLVKVGPPATMGHGSSPAGAEKREGSIGVLLQASPKLGWWCCDWALAMKRRWERSSSEEGEKEEGNVW
jgi:hypothetical protein